MWDRLKDKNPTVLGLYFGVILGAVVMMIAGGLGNTALGDMSLILGICAGPSIGYIIGKIQARKKNAELPEGKDPQD